MLSTHACLLQLFRERFFISSACSVTEQLIFSLWCPYFCLLMSTSTLPRLNAYFVCCWVFQVSRTLLSDFNALLSDTIQTKTTSLLVNTNQDVFYLLRKESNQSNLRPGGNPKNCYHFCFSWKSMSVRN